MKILKNKKTESQRKPRLSLKNQPVFQYRSNRSETERPLNRTEGSDETKITSGTNRFLQILKKSLIAATLILILILLTILTKGPELQISNYSQSFRPSGVYQQAVNQSVDNIFGMNKLTINRSKIENDLTNKFPEITDVQVLTPIFASKAKVVINISSPSLILQTPNGNSLVNQNGLTLGLVENFSEEKLAEILTLKDETAINIVPGEPAMSSSQIDFINEIQHQSKARNFKIQEAALKPGGGEMWLKYTEANYWVKYNLYENPRHSFGTFVSTKEYSESNNQQVTEYIDVRVPERAYVK